jgi:hypothetical protein
VEQPHAQVRLQRGQRRTTAGSEVPSASAARVRLPWSAICTKVCMALKRSMAAIKPENAAVKYSNGYSFIAAQERRIGPTPPRSTPRQKAAA